MDCDVENELPRTHQQEFSISNENVNQINGEHLSKSATKYRCDPCKKEFSLKGTWKRHMDRIHVPSEKVKCKQCDKMTFSYYMKRHEKLVHSNRVRKKAKCESCGKDFASMSHLNEHKKRIHTPAEKIPCEKCQKRFLPRDINGHVKLVHTFKDPVKCDICDKEYKNDMYLKLHKSIAHKGFRFKCSKCDREFTSTTALKNHVSRVHDKLVFDCDICKKTGFSLLTFKNHNSIKHNENSLKVGCEICGKTFACQRYLNIHTSVVHKEKGIKEKKNSTRCDPCQRNYSSKGNLEQHIKRKHSTVEMVKCHLCGKDCIPSSFKKHLDTHVKTMDFKCEPCGKEFKHENSF